MTDRKFLSSILHPDRLRMFFPMGCPLCGGIPFDGSPNMFCADCLRKLQFVREPYCPSCGGELNGILEICSDCAQEKRRPWKQAYAVFQMQGLVKDVIHFYKYRNRPELARAFGKLAGDRIRASGASFDLLVPTPLHWKRFLWRGFNQAELIAAGISSVTGVPVCSLLRRVRDTRQQAKLGRDERIANLADAFVVKSSTKCKGRAILLIDDVMTTGSTLSAAAQTLLTAGASEVSVLVMARRQRI